MSQSRQMQHMQRGDPGHGCRLEEDTCAQQAESEPGPNTAPQQEDTQQGPPVPPGLAPDTRLIELLEKMSEMFSEGVRFKHAPRLSG